ncbi:MAG: succinate dehydrogenase, hydrophobic membrane anchor protein [Mariprofundaceae bacterium]|nr:succinate dehydrogenase, hydrophobic membrane anchor protein [Mariprofundaceae bacterium]
MRYGSAHNGLNEWYLQRLSAVVVALLMPLIFALMLGVYNGSLDQMQLLNLLNSHLGRTLHTLFLLALLSHAYLGIKVLVEDYIHIAALRIVLMGLVLSSIVALGIWWLAVIWAWGS